VTAQARQIVPWLCIAAFILGIANFLWFFVESQSIGGDALNGYVRDGHWFVGSHGAYREVPEGTWMWSRVHAISLLITHPLAIGAAAVFAYTGGSLHLGGLRGTAAGRLQRAEWALAGEFVAAESARIQLGGLTLPRRTTITVTRRGIVARVGWECLSVLASELRDVFETTSQGRYRLSIGHDGIDVPSPLILGVERSGPVAAAIRALPASAVAGPATEPTSEPARAPGGEPPPAPSATGRPSAILLVAGLAGLIVTGVMAAIGVFWAIPRIGPFGWLWTGGVLAIGFVNLRRWWRSVNS
jgi:hypothetical protein